MLDAVHALVRELIHPVRLDILLGLKAELLLDLDLHPKALGVKAVLIAAVLALHGVVAQEGVLERAAPGVVDAHRVVGRDRPVDEAEALVPGILRFQLAKAVVLLPELHDLVFHCDKFILIRHYFNLRREYSLTL